MRICFSVKGRSEHYGKLNGCAILTLCSNPALVRLYNRKRNGKPDAVSLDLLAA